MSSARPNQTLSDYVAIAICPALIMGLIGSLVFFLLEVLYSGAFVERLRWILFFFVFGAVLNARISMSGEIAGRAGMYGGILALLTWIGMQQFVTYPDAATQALSWAINLGLVALVWWCAHRLTWDCTNVDEETQINAEGVLQAAGLDKEASDDGAGSGDHAPTGVVENTESDSETFSREPPASESPAENKAPLNWWERYQRYRAEQVKKGRTLGVWVVYFSLAALPLFGLGQALIPVEDEGRRQFAFWMMSIYVACGLGLLLTTCYLGLRRYLRQRNLKMPAAMTGVWLTMGGSMVVVLLLLGALLPRPHMEYALFDFQRASSKEREASKYAVKGDNPGKGEGRASDPDPKNADKDGGGKDGKGQSKDGNGQGKDGSSGKDGKDGKASGKDGKDGKSSSSNKDKDSGNSGKDGDKSNQSKDGKDGAKSKDGKDGAKDKDDKSDNAQGQKGNNASSPPNPSISRITSFLSRLSPILKWIVFGLIAVIVVVMVLRSGLKFLANFMQWARDLLNALRNFWASLFGGGRKRAATEGGEGEEFDAGPPRQPFSSFHNPFLDGSAGRMSPQELLRYTFAALQAWAWERDLGRNPGETPLEFARRLGDEFPALEAEVRLLALLYARAVYARGGLPASAAESVRQFWERLETVSEQPLSAGA
jgi:hypothetical protein